MGSRSRPARASALEIGNDLHSSVKIHDSACHQKISAATANVPIAETRAAIFRNVAIPAVIPRLGNRSIRTSDPTVNDHLTKCNDPLTKGAHCEHCEATSHARITAVAGYGRAAREQHSTRIRFAQLCVCESRYNA